MPRLHSPAHGRLIATVLHSAPRTLCWLVRGAAATCAFAHMRAPASRAAARLLRTNSSCELASNPCSRSPMRKQASCEHRTIRSELVPSERERGRCSDARSARRLSHKPPPASLKPLCAPGLERRKSLVACRPCRPPWGQTMALRCIFVVVAPDFAGDFVRQPPRKAVATRVLTHAVRHRHHAGCCRSLKTGELHAS